MKAITPSNIFSFLFIKMSNLWLANYIETNIIPDIQKSHKVTGTTLQTYWLSRLRNNERLPRHELDNLAIIINMVGYVIGKDYRFALRHHFYS